MTQENPTGSTKPTRNVVKNKGIDSTAIYKVELF